MWKPVDYARRTIRNTAVVVSFSLLGGLLGYFIRLLFARNLSVADFGLFYAIYAFISLSSIVRTLGLNDALVHHLARFQVARKKDMIIAAIRRVISIEL